MNRSELIVNIAKRTGFDKSVVCEFINAYESAIYETIRRGESVLLQGFMKIERKTKKAYVGHGFGTKDTKIIPEHDIVKIRPGITLMECVNG